MSSQILTFYLPFILIDQLVLHGSESLVHAQKCVLHSVILLDSDGQLAPGIPVCWRWVGLWYCNVMATPNGLTKIPRRMQWVVRVPA